MSEKYRSNAQQRILKILIFLAGHEVDGLAPGEISKGLVIAPSHVTHDLANLRIAGLAEEVEGGGRWRLSPKLPQIGVAMLNGYDRAKSKLDEVGQRYTRNPH